MLRRSSGRYPPLPAHTAREPTWLQPLRCKVRIGIAGALLSLRTLRHKILLAFRTKSGAASGLSAESHSGNYGSVSMRELKSRTP